MAYLEYFEGRYKTMSDSVVRRLRHDDKFRAVRMTERYAVSGSCRLDRSTSAYELAHVVVVVDDLDRAVDDYRALGFTVTTPQQVEGSGVKRSCIFFTHARRTHLELISSHSGLATRALNSLRFGSAHLRRDAPARRTMARAIRWTGDTATDDSSPIRTNVFDGLWFRRRSQANDASSPTTEVTPPQQRPVQNPRGHLSQHANGTTGIASITVAVKDLERAVASYSARLGTQPFHWLDSPLLSVRIASFSLGNTTFKLAQPTGEGAVNDYLKVHGEGPCALTFQTTTSTRRLDDARTHGLRLELVGDDARAAEEPDYL